MVDVIFQLVVFFMVSSTFIITPGISLVLPSSQTAEPVAMTKLVITVVARDEIYFNKERHTLASLNSRLAEISDTEREQIKTVILEGDRSISYSLLVEILDVLRINGFKAVNLRTREQ
jgi:biopolymer transport protein ExbD